MKRFELRRAVVLLVSVAAFLACAKGDSDRRAPRTGQMPGALTKAVDEYSGDEFYEFVHRLEYAGGRERQRTCRNDPACAGVKRTLVRVEAIATQDSIGPKTTPRYGVVYVRAINKGDAVESRYGLAPGKQFEYFMIVSADSAGGMKWRLEQLDTTPKARRHTQVGAGSLIGCNHKWIAGASADFKSCARAAAAHDGLIPQNLADDPLWATCEMGCCEYVS